MPKRREFCGCGQHAAGCGRKAAPPTIGWFGRAGWRWRSVRAATDGLRPLPSPASASLHPAVWDRRIMMGSPAAGFGWGRFLLPLAILLLLAIGVGADSSGTYAGRADAGAHAGAAVS